MIEKYHMIEKIMTERFFKNRFSQNNPDYYIIYIFD